MDSQEWHFSWCEMALKITAVANKVMREWEIDTLFFLANAPWGLRGNIRTRSESEKFKLERASRLTKCAAQGLDRFFNADDVKLQPFPLVKLRFCLGPLKRRESLVDTKARIKLD
jgi:hypothetical protein